MIGLDTNVPVRSIMQDDVTQARLASELMEALTVDEPGFIALVAVIELVWVLSSSFELVPSQVVHALEVLLQTKEIQVENAEMVWRAVRL